MEGIFLRYGNRLCIGRANLLGNFIIYVARGHNRYTEMFLEFQEDFLVEPLIHLVGKSLEVGMWAVLQITFCIVVGLDYHYSSWVQHSPNFISLCRTISRP